MHVTVLGVVELILTTEGEVVDASEVAHFVGDDSGMHFAEVTIGERVGTEAGVDSLGFGFTVAIGVDVLKDIDGGEEVTHKATRLILVRISGTQHVVAAAAQEAVVPLGSDRAEVLLLEVTVALEVEGAVGSTTIAVTVVGVRHDGVDRVGGS